MGHRIKDTLHYKKEEYEIDELPLIQYLELKDIKLVGAIASWEIKENKLYLVDLLASINPDDKSLFSTMININEISDSNLKDKYPPFGIEYLFPNKKEVFAEWYTGGIKLPRGEKLFSSASTFCDLYQEELCFIFNKGILTDTKIISNKEKLANHMYRYDSTYKYKFDINEAIQLKSKKKYDDAMNCFVSILIPSSIQKFHFKVFLQIKSCFKNALKKDANNAMTYFYMGVIYTTQKKQKKAEKQFKKAEIISFNSAEDCKKIGQAYYGLGEACYHFGLHSEKIGNSSYGKNIYDKKAMTYFQKSIGLNPNVVDGYMYYNMGNISLKDQDYTTALHYYQKAISIGIKDVEVRAQMSKNYYQAGMFFFENGDTIMTMTCFQNAIKLNPDYAPAYNALGCIYYQNKKYIEAINHFLKTIELDPEYHKPYHNLSFMLKDCLMEFAFTQKAAQLGDVEDQESLKTHGFTWYGNIGNIKETINFLRNCDDKLTYLKSSYIENVPENLNKDNAHIENGVSLKKTNRANKKKIRHEMMPEGFGEYGLEATNPIPMHSIPESYLYLENLTTSDGLPVTNRRIGSIIVENIPHIIDEYLIFANKTPIATLYICPYYFLNATTAPKGFHLELNLRG